jgi:8-oxo-dGTP pyrophosphatase MutT (NUDIX family)
MRKDRTKYYVLPRVVVFVYHENKILLIEKSIEDENGKSTPIFYPIGGHVEPGEDIKDAGIREVYEETGIDNSNPELKALIYNTGFDNYQIILFIFRLYVNDDFVKESKEGKLKWINISELGNTNVFKDVEIFHNSMEKSDSNEILFGTSIFEDFKLKEVILNQKKLF